MTYLKKELKSFKLFNMVLIAIFLYIVTQSWFDTEMSFKALFDGWGYMVSYMQGNPDIEGSSFFPPNIYKEDLVVYFLAMVETVQMAVIALLLSVIMAIPLSYITSRNILELLIPGKSIYHVFTKSALYTIGTLIANIFRSVNELVWALIFVSAVGLGPMAGILALGVHTAGVLSKLLSEGNEASKPKIILADEPLSALDQKSARKIMEIFKKVNKEMGVSILMNLHYLNTAKEFCDRILGIKNGQIIFNGKPEELNEDIVNEIYNNKSWI